MIYAVKGNVIFSKSLNKLIIMENSFIVVKDTVVVGVYEVLPKEYEDIDILDYGNSLIIPGLVDLHVHAPQFANIGLGLDKELMPWLETYTFPEECKFSDLKYAKKIYSAFIHELWKNGTTRSCVFATLHKDATKLLMDLFHESGLGAYVGKVNMNINSPEFLIETANNSIRDTLEIIKEYSNKYSLVKPIITPRFVPTCSFDLLESLGKLALDFNIPVQSHLSENVSEVEFVKQLFPQYETYADVYDAANLFGQTKTVMAHCVLVNEREIDLLAKKNIFVAHCPNSNNNLCSGIAPIRKLLSRNIPIGLATDVSGGQSLSMLNVMTSCLQSSNIKYLQDLKKDSPLNFQEIFYLATKGGGKFFGNVGSFEKDYEFDALIIDDSTLSMFKDLTIEERLQKFIYTGDDRTIKERFVAGFKVNEPKVY